MEAVTSEKLGSFSNGYSTAEASATMDRQYETAETEHVSHSEQEEKKTFVITGRFRDESTAAERGNVLLCKMETVPLEFSHSRGCRCGLNRAHFSAVHRGKLFGTESLKTYEFGNTRTRYVSYLFAPCPQKFKFVSVCAWTCESVKQFGSNNTQR